MPDTITQWLFNVYCLTTDGARRSLRFASTQTLSVERSFFLKVDAPKSVVDGEEFEVQVFVFNYLNDSLSHSVIVDVEVEEGTGSKNRTPQIQCIGAMRAISLKSWRFKALYSTASSSMNIVAKAYIDDATLSCNNEQGKRRRKLSIMDSEKRTILVKVSKL